MRQVKGSMLMSVDYHRDFYQVCWCQKIPLGIGSADFDRDKYHVC